MRARELPVLLPAVVSVLLETEREATGEGRWETDGGEDLIMATTAGNWQWACDSYGKVRHSRKACVFTTVKGGTGGDQLVTVAGRIENWEDAKLLAAAPELLTAARLAIPLLVRLGDFIANADDRCEVIGALKDAIDKAEGRI